MEKEPFSKKEKSFSTRLATFIVDKRNLFCLLIIIGIIFSLFSRNWVKVENDLIAYLPSDSETKLGMDIMEEQFITLGSAQIMVANVTYEKASELYEEICEIEGVQSVSFDQTTAHYQNASALFGVTFDYEETDERCETSLAKIKELLSNLDVYVDSDIGYSLPDIISKEVETIIVYVAVIIVIVLLFTSQTYAEIPVLLLTFIIAAVLNMGTNFLMGTISFVSNSVTTILQLALSLDYAVILCNRYKEEHKILPIREAVISALSKAIPEISASSLTTIGGLFAMVFMQFKIGPDMGINLIKSILFALFSVFVAMPALLVWFGPLMDKTKHKNFIPKISFVGKFAYTTRFIIPIAFVVLLAGAWKFSNDCPYVYGYTNLETVKLNEAKIAENMIADTFTSPEMVALVVPSGDYQAEGAILQELSQYEEVSSTLGIADADAIGGYKLSDSLTPREFSELADVDYELAQLVYAAYAAKEEEYARIINNLSTYEVPLIDIFLFVCEQADAGLITLDKAQMQMLNAAKTQMASAKAQLQGEDYSRMLVYLDIPEGGDTLYSFLDTMRETAQEYYPEQDVYVVGNATSEYDFQKTFARDNVVVNVLTILIVLAVLLFTFKSVGMPLLLILVIQGSIWMNFSVPTIQQQGVFFMTYLIVSAIQMGANIDYAIVIASRYMEIKDQMSPKQAVIETMNFAFPTILVSGTILATAGAFIGRMTSECSIANIGVNLSRGTIISIFLVMFVLPQILLIGSKIIDKTSFSVPNLMKTAPKVLPVILAVWVGSQNIVTVQAENLFLYTETIYIQNEEDFFEFAKNCTLDTWSVDKMVILQTNLDLSETVFEPIPTFGGTFDGQGYCISGIELTQELAPSGLFGVLQQGGVVKNVNVIGTITPSGENDYVGGIVGINAGEIRNCTFTGTVSGTQYVGGIAGENQLAGTIINCRVSGEITGEHMAGGIAGYHQGSITKCENTALVKQLATEEVIETASDIGGIAGYCSGMIEQCTNKGTIGYTHIGYNVGGIAGRSCGYILECSNEGEIYGRKDVGGIVGQAEPYTLLELSESSVAQIAQQTEHLNQTLDQTKTHIGEGSTAAQKRVQSLQDSTAEIQKLLNEKKIDEHQIARLQVQMNLIERQMKLLYAETTQSAGTLGDDIKKVSDQTEQLSNTFQQAVKEAEALSVDYFITDVSLENLEEATFGKITLCTNQNVVYADKNVGGIVGIAAMEYELDPEDDTNFRISLQEHKQYNLIAVISENINYAPVRAKKNQVGGICGSTDIGVVSACENYGYVCSENGDYVGGICGITYSTVQDCFAKCSLYGRTYIGGIVGSGSDAVGERNSSIVQDCYSFVEVEAYEQFVGAISGVNTGEYLSCFFVSDELAGINRINYETKAEAISYEALLEVANLPKAFQVFSVRFVANGTLVDTIQTAYGENVEEADMPKVPLLHGREGVWEVTALSDITKDITIQAVYEDAKTVLASTTVRDDERPVFLAEGQFEADAVLKAVQMSTKEETTLDIVELWNVEMPQDGLLIHTLRYLAPTTEQKPLQLYIKQDGEWIKTDTQTMGSYEVFSIAGTQAEIAVVAVKETWKLWMALAVGMLLVVGGGVWLVYKKKDLLKWLIGIVTVLLAAAIVCLAVVLLRKNFFSSVETYQMLQDYINQPQQSFQIQIDTALGEEAYQITADVFCTEVSGKKVTSISIEDMQCFYADGILYLENGKAYQTSEVSADYANLLQLLTVLYASSDVEVTKADVQKIYSIQIKEDAAQEILTYLLPSVSTEALTLQTLKATFLAQEEVLQSITLTSDGKLQDEAHTKYDITAHITMLEAEANKKELPDSVKNALEKEGTPIQTIATKDVLCLYHAWESLYNQDVMGAEIKLHADCGLLSLQQELSFISSVTEGKRIQSIQKDGFTVYFDEDSVCSENGYAVTTNRAENADIAQLLEVAYALCLEGDFECVKTDTSYIYTIALDKAGMKKIASYIAKESQDLAIQFENGSLQLVVSEETLQSIQFHCAGELNVILAKTPVSLSAELVLSGEEAFLDYTVPQKVLDKLKNNE